MELEGRTVVVTGAGGFLGSRLVGELASIGCRIRRVFGRARAVPQPAGLAEISDHVHDLRQADAWEELLPGADVVYHLAAQTSVYVAERQPDADFAANVQSVRNLGAACRRLGVRPIVVMAGTATETGVTTTVDPIDETRADAPATVYDLHKLLAEQHVEFYTRAGVMDGVTLRLCNVYGPGPEASGPERGFVNAMVRRAVAGQSLTRYDGGDWVRDYVFVDDVVRAFVAAARSAGETAGRHFLIGTGRGMTIAEALETIADRAALAGGRRVAVEVVAAPAHLSPIERRQFVANTAAFQRASGWRAAVPFRDGIDATIAAARRLVSS